MSYQQKHIPVVPPQEGYNRLAATYSNHHDKLDQWDRGLFSRFLPRDLRGLDVVDLGGGDGRTARWFVDKPIGRYVIVDVAQDLLNQAPAWIETVHRDLTQERDLDQQFDILLAHFLVIHIEDLTHFFAEASDYMNSDARLIVVHHLERRPYLHTLPDGKFRIASYMHRFERLEAAVKDAGLMHDYIDLAEQGSEGTRIYCCYQP